VGAYEDLVRNTVEAALQPGEQLTIRQLWLRVFRIAGPDVPAPGLTMLELVLREDPVRFVEVGAGSVGAPRRRARGRGSQQAQAAAGPEARQDAERYHVK